MENATFELTSELTEAELTRVSAQFESAAPETILAWALEEFGQDVALATGFGAEGCVLVHMLAQINPTARMFYLDTGLLFPETYELKAKLETRYGVQIERRASRLSVDAQARLHGDRLWEREPNRCCQLRKIEPLV
ncbi:MAG TPA: phosphoadenosine phosphosulfate reductase family protein, partial [Acidobacteriota bacterium]|nr:phosphoadenosine phosphosulfate reductase family protein [Acidobacteriota bacterium]